MASDDVPLLSLEENEDHNPENCLDISVHRHNEIKVIVDNSSSYFSDDISYEDDSKQTQSRQMDDDSVEKKCSTLFDDSLPEGKKYHLFISFSSEDKELVKPVVEGLEKKGLRCMYADRDFEQGDEVTNNIVNRLQESMKILLMLTPNFVQSGPCSYETHKAEYIYYLMENRRNCIIPLMLLPCEIPISLKSVTYIDASFRNEATLVNQIVEAFFNNDQCENYLPNHLTWPSVENGITIVTVRPQKKSLSKRGMRYEYRGLKDFEIQDLKEAGIQTAATIYERIRMEINSQYYMALPRCDFCCLNFFMVYVWFFLLALTIALYQRHLSVFLVIFPFVVSIVAACGIRFFLGFISKKKTKNQLHILWTFARTYIGKEKFFIVKTEWGIEIMKYDTRPCLDTITCRLRNDLPDIPDDIIQELAEGSLKETAWIYIFSHDFSWWDIPRGIQRHRISTLSKKECLCEMYFKRTN